MASLETTRWLAALVCAVALALPQAAPAQPHAQDPQARIANERRSVIVEAVQHVSPSVAAVVISGIQRVSVFNDPIYRDYFGLGALGPTTERRVTVQSGSAVMVSADGHFITNEHVVAGADAIALLLPNGETRAATVIGTSAKLDLALLQCDPEGLQPATLGTAEDLMVGEWLVAVGYPVGGREVTGESRFRPTVTVGVVSALERSFTPSRPRRDGERLFYPDMIQTDAAINPGNSGGPLANASGEIVGINTFILTESGGSQGLGFAIPIERALQATDELLTYGHVRDVDFTDLRLIVDMTEETARSLDLPEPRGLLVSDPGIAADDGLRADDVILDIGGKRVDTAEEARLALVSRFVGDRVVLGLWRAGSRVEIPLVLTAAREQR